MLWLYSVGIFAPWVWIGLLFAGDRDIQLQPGRSDDWRYAHPGLSFRYFCLGRKTSQLQK